MLCISLAGRVTVGVVMGFLIVVVGVSPWAAAVSSIDAAAKADTSLMRTMAVVLRGDYVLLVRGEGKCLCPLYQQMWTVVR